MSSYDAAIIDVTILEDPALLVLPRGMRLLHIEGYVWSRAQRTDGAIPRYLLPRIAFGEPDPEAAAAALVDAGLWTATETGWTIVGYLTTQWSRETVQRKRADNRKRYEEWVKRQGEKPSKRPSKAKRDANAFANDPDTDADSDPDPEREGESAGRSGADAGLQRPVVARSDEAKVSTAIQLIQAPTTTEAAKRMAWKQLDVLGLESIEAALDFIERAERLQAHTVDGRYLRSVEGGAA